MTKKPKQLSLDEYERQLGDEVPRFVDAMRAERAYYEFSRQIRRDLHDLREALDIKQTAVASALGMTQSGVSRFEKGEGDVGLVAVCRYASALGLEPALTFVPTASSYRGGSMHRLLRAIATVSSRGKAAPQQKPDTDVEDVGAPAPHGMASRAAAAQVILIKGFASQLAEAFSKIAGK